MRPNKLNLIVIPFLLAAVAPARAGELSPPPGPIAPTMKTLAQVEPRIPINAQTCPGGPTWSYGISQPGSYYMESDLTGEPNKHGIRIGADGVTIDMNGYTLIGVPDSWNGIDGGVLEVSNVTVRNGSIRGFGEDAMDTEATASGWRVENVRATYNGNGFMLCRQCVITNCIANDNVGTGFAAIWSSSFENCVANGGNRGYSVAYGTTLLNCAAQYNNDYGFSLYGGSTATNCAARSNGTDGFVLNEGSSITGCTASNNDRDGIRLNLRNTATNNTCDDNGPSNNGAGIRTIGQRNRVQGNSVTGNYYPIKSDAGNNFFIQNTASGNLYLLGYAFDPASTYGPTVTGAGAIGSTSPWANFIH